MDAKTGEVRYGFAHHLRKALPEATFVGFTETPVEMVSAKTYGVWLKSRSPTGFGRIWASERLGKLFTFETPLTVRVKSALEMQEQIGRPATGRSVAKLFFRKKHPYEFLRTFHGQYAVVVTKIAKQTNAQPRLARQGVFYVF